MNRIPKLACVLLALVTVAAAQPAQRTLAVTGTAQVGVEPDICLMTFVISTEHEESASKAYHENNRLMSDVRNAILDLGIEPRYIQTRNFTITPQYRWDDDIDDQVFTGYAVTHDLFIKLHDIEKVSDVLDAAVGAGATQVSGVSFTVENPKDYLAEARVEAINAARAKAELIAETAGVTLLRPLTIHETEPGSWGTYYAQANVALERTGWTDNNQAILEPGEVKLSHTVHITYEIK